jgi:hypothetical protein
MQKPIEGLSVLAFFTLNSMQKSSAESHAVSLYKGAIDCTEHNSTHMAELPSGTEVE